MQVYKAYFKVIKNRLPSIMLYLVVFVAVAIIIASLTGSGSNPAAFEKTKSRAAVFDGDDSPLSRGLADYIAQNSKAVDIADNGQEIEDALFYNQVDYVLRIPQGFAQNFLAGSTDTPLLKTVRPGSAASVYTDFLVRRYLNMAGLYAQNSPGIEETAIVQNVAQDLQNAADAEVKEFGKSASVDLISYYFRYMAYSILAIILMGVTSFMMVFNEKDLNRRILCSPLKPVNLNLQIVLGNLTFTVAVWVILLASVFLLYGSVSINTGIVLLCLNALVFSMVALSIAFLAGKFIRNPGVQSAVTNVFSLGLSFLSGAFVEQALLGKAVLDIASFTPVYWYVKAVEDIRSVVDFTAQNTAPIVNSMLIQLGFAVAILIVALVVTKQKRASLA